MNWFFNQEGWPKDMPLYSTGRSGRYYSEVLAKGIEKFFAELDINKTPWWKGWRLADHWYIEPPEEVKAQYGITR